MQIQTLKIKGLYGYIDKVIDFNKDITLLVGINGSGKTSTLNIINWMLKPSIPDLCVTEFTSIELLLRVKDIEHCIVCTHDELNFRYEIQKQGKLYTPLKVRLKMLPKHIKNDETLKLDLFNAYSRLSPDEDEKETWDLISTIPSPTIIGLDRNLYIEEAENIYIEEAIIGRVRKNSNTKPLNKVKDIVNKEYRKNKNAVLKLTSSLKNHLMLSAFQGGITIASFTSGLEQNLTLKDIDMTEERVTEYFSKFETALFSEKERGTIATFFLHLKDIIVQYQKNPEDETVKLLYSLNAGQFVKVKKLLKEFLKFEKDSASALENINIYIATLNHFLKDSAKQLIFNDDTSELVFNTLDKNGKVITEYNDIKNLSSGEQQILILFSYISFNSSDGRIFIVDEPELSLHIKWQEDFLLNLEKITPKSTQVILATHSPILAGKRKTKSTILLPY